jgi:hypothetical protein
VSRLRPVWPLAAALVLGLGVFLIREHQLAGAVGFPLDDPWIHLRFARNLAEGQGFAYNPGVPVSGSTAPLWTLLLGALFRLVGSEPLVAKAAGSAATLAAAWLAARLALEWTADHAAAAVAGVLTALAGPLLWGALSGMEVTLAAALVTGGLLAHVTGRDSAAAGLLALAVLARPESVLVFVLVWAAGSWAPRRAAIFALALAAAVGPWVAFNLATVGSPLPATAAAKIESGLVGVLSGHHESSWSFFMKRPWRYLVEWVKWLDTVNGLFPLMIPPGLWLLWRRGGRRFLLPGAALVLHPLAMALLASFRGPGFQEGRYSIQLLPLAAAVATLPLAALTAWSPTSNTPPTAPRRLSRLLAAGLVVAALAGLWPAATRYGWAVQNIEAMQGHLGRWIAANTPGDARLALNDVGAIGYLSRREVVDVMGLVTPDILPYRRDGELGVLRYLEHACPDYLIIFPRWFPRLIAMPEHFSPIYRVRLQRNSTAGAEEMVVYETVWSRANPAPRPCPQGPRASTMGGDADSSILTPR